eukprot:7671964-Pyramimonas_sp.AAC.2
MLGAPKWMLGTPTWMLKKSQGTHLKAARWQAASNVVWALAVMAPAILVQCGGLWRAAATHADAFDARSLSQVRTAPASDSQTCQ